MESNKSEAVVLQRLGLSEIQSLLYLTSLEHGMLTVLELSKLTGVSRQQIYDEADKLLDLGLYEVTNKRRRKYIAANPRKLVKVAEEKNKDMDLVIQDLRHILPNLESLPKDRKNTATVRYFEGLAKVKEAYDEELELSQDTEVLSFAGSIENSFQFLSEAYWDRWNRKFVKSNSKSRMLVHFSPSAKKTAAKDREYKRETRYLDAFPLKANIDVFNNSVLIVSFSEEMAIWIDSPILAESYRSMFNALWMQAKPF